MKQKLLLLLFALLTTSTAWAYDAEIDGIYYNLDRNEAMVTYRDQNYNSYSGAVVVPESVTYNNETYNVIFIGDRAFYKCIGLTSITIPGSVTTIGESAFNGCSGLTSITIPNGVTSIGYGAFFQCSGLTSVTIPESVTSIGDYAFYDCKGLTSVTIPNSVTSISYSAFRNCSGLTSVTIPESVTSIGNNVFSGCSGLTSIIVETGNTTYDSRNNCNAIIKTASNTLIGGCQNTVIPNSVTSIGYGAFSECSGLTSITIPNSVTSIGDYAFYGCNNLQYNEYYNACYLGNNDNPYLVLIKPQSINITTCVINEKCTLIYGGAFEYCSGLTSVIISESVTSIGNNAFSGCSGLTSVIVETGNATYDSRNYCNAIIKTASNTLICGCQNTVIPNSVTSIGNLAFSSCSGLTSVTIPNSVTSIGSEAFYYCSGLTSVTIGDGVTSIGWYAFYGCNGLKNVYCYAENVPTTRSDAFHNSPIAKATLHVPAGSTDAYKEAVPWKNFGRIVELAENPGDLNGDSKVDIADAANILNLMAEGSDDSAADLNWDGKVDIADFVSVLNLMAGQ